jgi:TolB-like protein/class 3 adenylate cyclase/Flp pilus assembly protein TadD
MSENIHQRISPSRRLAAIIFTDIVGYTSLMGKDAAKALELVRISKDIQKPLVEKHNGKWLKEMGDGAMAQFYTALDAVKCAIEIQETARAKFDGKLRIGIHLGDITIENGDVYGDGVNIASRLQAIADPGGIYISESIEKAMRGHAEFRAKYLGEIKLKNVSYEVRTYALQGVGLPVPNLDKEKQLFDRFRAEIYRRGVVPAGAAYFVLSLLLILLVSFVKSWIPLPEWILAALISVLIIGFPIAMYLAWNYERSPEGFIRTTSVQSWRNPYTSSQRKPLTNNLIIIVMALIIVVLYVQPRYFTIIPKDIQIGAGQNIDDKSIAVIPFENLSADENNQYFADGQMEAILNHLTRIAELRVISRTTMMGYSGTSKTLPEIAKELGVRYVLEGSVQKAGEKVRITAQLIDSESDAHLWANSYDRDLTDIFTIHTEIAKSVARELKATITSREQNNIESVPTSDLTAYDYYLKGMDYENRGAEMEDLPFAFQMYQRAVDIDPEFTLAWVGLASTSRKIYWFYYDRSEENLEQTKEYLDKAISLDPDLMEVLHETGSYYYHCKLDYQRALDILLKLKSEYPKSERVHATISYVYRRMGQLQKALSYAEHAISLNPSEYNHWSTTGQILNILGKYSEAEEYVKRSMDLNPSFTINYIVLTGIYLNMGEVNKARLLIKDYRHIDHNRLYANRVKIELFDRNYEEAINILENSPFEAEDNQSSFMPKFLQLGLIYYIKSEKALARIHFEEARKVLEDKLKVLPDDSRIYSSLGIAFAGLGMNEEAINASKKALELMNISIDAMRGRIREWDFARTLMMVGEYEEAIKKIDFLLDQYGNISVEQIKIDPFWDPLRDMDTFKELLANPKYQVIRENI